MKRKEKAVEPLKLMRWANDHYPPINLSDKLTHVVALIEEVRKLRKEVEELKKN